MLRIPNSEFRTPNSRLCQLAALAALFLSFGCDSTTAPSFEEISVDPSNPPEPLSLPSVGESDWPWWRGLNRNGTAVGEQPPVEWDEDKNIVWKAAVPGRGHSSPTIVADRVFLTTADERQQVQSVVCYDRETGERLWKSDIHKGNFPSAGNHESSHASCTVACDGERVFAVFFNKGAIGVTALDLDGRQLWQTDVGPFLPQFGYAPSPAIHESLLIVAADSVENGYLAALHRKSGQIVWRKSRPGFFSFSSPVVVPVAGRDQLLISGCKLVAGYDPNTGEQLWSCPGTAETTCGTAVFEDDLVFAGGGHPERDTLCVRADGSAEVLWRTRRKAYVPSMLVYEGHVYAIDGELGIVYCWKSETGELKWRTRLTPAFRASPILAGDNIYAPNRGGTTFVFKANPQEYESVAQSQLGDEIYATPSICGGRIYLRAADSSSGTRKETLYCIGIPN